MIQLPGDPERRERERRLREGVPLDEGTWGQLVELAGRLGVAVPV
jgi:LDH2 family malate/lactate/ureidoglycolate dehydrogenase